MKNVSDYREALIINKHNLDLELTRQPELFFEVAEAYTEAASMRDALYENTKNTDSSVNMEIREDYANKGTKITEAQITALVQTHPDHVQAYEDYLNAKRTAEEFSALKDAFHQRSSMLRDLVQLYATGYFERTSVTVMEIDATNARQSMGKQAMSERRKVIKRPPPPPPKDSHGILDKGL